MSKKKIVLIMSLVITLTVPFQAFAAKNLEPVKSLSFDEVKPLMMTRCQTILENVEAYSDTADAQDTGEDQIDSLLNVWSSFDSSLDNYKAKAGSDPDLEDVLTYLLNAQKQSLQAQKGSFASQNISDMGLQTEQGNYTIVWNMESLFIQYNDLERQLQDMQAQKPLIEKKLEIAKLQKELGLATDKTVLEAESQLDQMGAGIQQLEESKEMIKQTFNVNLAQPYDTELTIEEVPDVTEEQIQAIDVDADFEKAVKESYAVKLNDNEDDKENDAKRKFENSFYRAYQDILDKQKALEAEKANFAVAETNLKIAEAKYELGMLSSLQYDAEKNSFISKENALEKAKDNLFKAYRQYQWAKQGLIVSNSQG